MELSHWLFHILQNPKSDIAVTLAHFKLDTAKAQKDLGAVIDGLRKNATEMPQISEQLTDVLDRGWHYATLMFGEAMIRTGHILVAALKNTTLRRDLVQMSKVFGEINVYTWRMRRAPPGPTAMKTTCARWMALASARVRRGGVPRSGQHGPGPFCGRYDGAGRVGQDGPDRWP